MSACLGCQTLLPDPDGPCPKCGAVVGTDVAPLGEMMLEAAPLDVAIEVSDALGPIHVRPKSNAPNPLIASLVPISRGPTELARPHSLPPKPTFTAREVEHVALFDPPPESWLGSFSYRRSVKARLVELNRRLEIRQKIMTNARHDLEELVIKVAEHGMRFLPGLTRDAQRAYYTTTSKLQRLSDEIKALGPDAPAAAKIREEYRATALDFGQVVLDNDVFGEPFKAARGRAKELRDAESAAEKDVLVHAAALSAYDETAFVQGATVVKVAVGVCVILFGAAAAFAVL